MLTEKQAHLIEGRLIQILQDEFWGPMDSPEKSWSVKETIHELLKLYTEEENHEQTDEVAVLNPGRENNER